MKASEEVATEGNQMFNSYKDQLSSKMDRLLDQQIQQETVYKRDQPQRSSRERRPQSTLISLSRNDEYIESRNNK